MAFDGSTGDPSTTTEGDLWYNSTANVFKYYDGSTVQTLSTGGGGGNTLDAAYDQGGGGAGRAITVDSNAVTMTNSAADNNNVLEITKSPAGAQSGSAVIATVNTNVTDPAVRVVVSGMASGVQGDDDRPGVVLEEATTSSGTHNSPVLAFHIDYVSEGPTQARDTFAVQATTTSGGSSRTLDFGHSTGDAMTGGHTLYMQITPDQTRSLKVNEGLQVTRSSPIGEIFTAYYPTLTGETPSSDSCVGMGAGSVEYTTGATIGTERWIQCFAPTFTATAATQNITSAATLYVDAAPVASTNVNITTPMAVHIDDGLVQIDADLNVDGVMTAGASSTIGFFGASAASQQTSGGNLTNNVTSGGTNDQIDNWSTGGSFASESTTIRNNQYQLARKLKQVNDALRLYGLLS